MILRFNEALSATLYSRTHALTALDNETPINATPDLATNDQVASAACSWVRANVAVWRDWIFTTESCPISFFRDEVTFEVGQPRGRCLPCPAGRYASQFGQPCQNCLPGSYTPSQSARSCIQCPLGRSRSLSGATSCRDCPDNTYSAEVGSEECLACPQYSQPDDKKTSCICSPDFLRDPEPPLQQGVFSTVQARGRLRCGTNVANPLFGVVDLDGNTRARGFDVDFCRAVAAAVFPPSSYTDIDEKVSEKAF